MEEEFYASGRGRRLTKKEERKKNKEIEGSIGCYDGVLLTPHKVKNSVRMLTTERYPNGIAEADIQLDALKKGMKEIASAERKMNNGEDVYIEEILSHAVVWCKNSYREINIDKSDLEYKEDILLFSYKDEERKIVRCTLDRISGKVISLKFDP